MDSSFQRTSDTSNQATAVDPRAEAFRVGFDFVGVARAQIPPHHDAYRAWVESGLHGPMEYLERHVLAKRHPEELLPGCRSVIMVGLNYNPPKPHPSIARYALGKDYHKVLTKKLCDLSAWLGKVAPTHVGRVCVDAQPLMERDFAQLAGIGWFGKNTMIINGRFGSWFVLGALLTTLELHPDEPARGSCGTCTRCVDACPTGAIRFEQDRWLVDARDCISTWTIEQKSPLTDGQVAASAPWLFGCDVCQAVCPFNEARASQPERAAVTETSEFLDWSGFARLSLRDIAMSSAQTLDSSTTGSPIRRAGLTRLQDLARRRLDQA